ncbi:MAG: hypothetical protein ABL907_08040 [Hyphomicrobium sp.]
MPAKPQDLIQKLWRGAVIAIWTARGILRTAWSIVRVPIIAALQVAAALVVLFEEWGWKPLSALLARLARYAPVAALERWIAGLPPYGALVVFALPTTVLLPLKFVAMWLLASGKYWTATALFAGAKVASTALIARIFTLTKPSLMQIAWFARTYGWFVPWKDHLFAVIRASWVWRYGRMVKTRMRLEAKQAWGRWRPALAPFRDAMVGRVAALRTTLQGLALRAFHRLRGWRGG